MTETFFLEEGSDNVFADLGIPNPEKALAKAKLAAKICQNIQEKGLTDEEASQQLEISQEEVINLLKGQLDEFSSDFLLGCLLALGCDIENTIKLQDRFSKTGI